MEGTTDATEMKEWDAVTFNKKDKVRARPQAWTCVVRVACGTLPMRPYSVKPYNAPEGRYL